METRRDVIPVADSNRPNHKPWLAPHQYREQRTRQCANARDETSRKSQKALTQSNSGLICWSTVPRECTREQGEDAPTSHETHTLRHATTILEDKTHP